MNTNEHSINKVTVARVPCSKSSEVRGLRRKDDRLAVREKKTKASSLSGNTKRKIKTVWCLAIYNNLLKQ